MSSHRTLVVALALGLIIASSTSIVAPLAAPKRTQTSPTPPTPQQTTRSHRHHLPRVVLPPPVTAECRSVRLMLYLAQVDSSSLQASALGEIERLRLVLCLTRTVHVVPPTRRWGNGRSAKDVHGQWFYPNGRPLRSVHRELLYPNGRTARTIRGDWLFPDRNPAFRRLATDVWYRPGHSGETLTKVLSWATTRLQPEDFRSITIARSTYDPDLETLAVIGVLWRAAKARR
ncbi:MAG: hypothetical protein KC609_21740 [Myxococcales bacterium]|nr:hypothetical protein [Myxococcales bacterium]